MSRTNPANRRWYRDDETGACSFRDDATVPEGLFVVEISPREYFEAMRVGNLNCGWPEKHQAASDSICLCGWIFPANCPPELHTLPLNADELDALS